MKRVLVVALGIAVFPSMAVAQTELGLDAGLVVTRAGGITLKTLQIPTSALRVGFHAGDRMIVESLATFTFVSSGGSSGMVLQLVPGLDFSVGDGGAYLRGEVGIALRQGGGSNSIELGFGGAIGARKTNADGTALVRVEAGVQRWPDDVAASTVIRLLTGFSVIVG